MNTALLTDPVVLISSGIILVGVIALFWAIGKFKSLGSGTGSKDVLEDMVSSSPALSNINFGAPEHSSPFGSARTPSVPAPAVSKDVSDRLEGMAQRLSEMQTVLMKQSTAPAAGAPGAPAGAAGGLGQGFSPETIDKLLKIIGNVIQQVDILQKSLNISK